MKRLLRRIPVRVHVNGTRGKSSVTRLIAAGLRAGGLRTCAKTTGTLARFIMPDGREFPVFRPVHTNILEQLRIVRAAEANGAEALVVECMALQPYLQWLSEARMVRATCAVITNARADHLDVMGPTEQDVALALALRVCEALGVERDTALRGMHAAAPDPGAMLVHELDFFGRRVVPVNAFAANDPESTERLWLMASDRYPELTRRVAVFNCRADRTDRSRQLGQALAAWTAARAARHPRGALAFVRSDWGVRLFQVDRADRGDQGKPQQMV